MKVKINGEDETLEKELSITALLEARAVKMPEMVTVEVNETIIDREAFDTTVIKEGDQVEFL